MKKLLATGLLICMFAANAQELEKPKIIFEKIGNVTNYRAEGNLEPTQYLSCVGLDSLKNTYTPPDLYTGVAACVKQKDYERAIDLFKLAGAYSFYDAQRVSDKTAAQGRTVLIMQLFDGFTEEEKLGIQKAFNAQTESNDKSLQLSCERIKKIGKPNYFPKYMILHGMNAFTGNPYENALVANFDQKQQWGLVVKNYLHCSE